MNPKDMLQEVEGQLRTLTKIAELLRGLSNGRSSTPSTYVPKDPAQIVAKARARLTPSGRRPKGQLQAEILRMLSNGGLKPTDLVQRIGVRRSSSGHFYTTLKKLQKAKQIQKRKGIYVLSEGV